VGSAKEKLPKQPTDRLAPDFGHEIGTGLDRHHGM